MTGKIEGYCICPSCGKKLPHYKGEPCFRTPCPECGISLERGHEDIDMTIFQHDEENSDAAVIHNISSPVVEKQACISCGICIDSCPANAIAFRDSYAFIQEDDCTNCELCLRICPQNAIHKRK